MAAPYSVPGVYFEQRPRAAEVPVVRTDIAGFIGFEPRVREAPPDPGGAVRVQTSSFQNLVGDRIGRVSGQMVQLTANPSDILNLDHSVVFALAAIGQDNLTLLVVQGAVAPTGQERRPDDSAVEAAAGTTRFARVVDVLVQRTAAAVLVTILPVRSLTRCDDFRDYVLAFGVTDDDGMLLSPAVRAFFANGGRRCWVATIRRPNFLDAPGLLRACEEMVGVPGASELEATGLERLLLVPEVTVVDVPDLYASRLDLIPRSVSLPAREDEGCFTDCSGFLGPGGIATSTGAGTLTPLYLPQRVFETQSRMLARAIPERWRVLLLFSVPRHLDPATGRHLPPTHIDAAAWVDRFDQQVKAAGFADTNEMSAAALYWPWTLCQEQVAAPVSELPPSAFAAGVIARRDLARGPQLSPANETLKQVVGLAATLDDVVHGGLYCPDPDAGGFAVPSLNVLRAFPGYGIQVWGARTLSTEPWLRFLAVRRTLTAIELRMKAALDLLVFEPNSPSLWLQITQIAFSVLFPLFESGALRGDRPEEAFYVRCDASVNPPESVALGLLVVEVGVAIAAPAEFIVFRLGRREGVVEVAGVVMPLTNPVPAFDFNVFMFDAKPFSSFGLTDLAGAGVGLAKAAIFGSFAEVSGLNAEMDTEEYREGGHNTGPHKFVKWGRYPDLVFKRGVTLNADIWDWYYATLYKSSDPVRKNGVIMLTDRGLGVTALTGGPSPFGLPGVDRLPVAVWFFRNALPEKLQGPQLNAKSNEIAIETLELVHEGLYRYGPAMIPGAIGDTAGAIGL